MPTIPSKWWVYIVKCADGSLYTGTAKNIESRIATHNLGKGAKYTKTRLPVSLQYIEEHLDRSAACKREAAIKKLSRADKQKIILQ